MRDPVTALGLIELEDLVALGVRAVVTTRAGGISTGPYASLNLGDHVGDDPGSVAANRARLATALALAPDALVLANQVHGARAAVVHRGDDPGDADAMVTTNPTIAICVLVADCVPMVLVDPDAHVLAVVHAGWRGIVAQTAKAAIDTMVGLGADPRRCRVHLGPCISPSAYQVGREVATAFRDVGCTRDVIHDIGDRYRVDLAGACARQLVARGVPPNQIARTALVTDGGQRFFSDRAQRPCGRFAMAARLELGDS